MKRIWFVALAGLVVSMAVHPQEPLTTEELTTAVYSLADGLSELEAKIDYELLQQIQTSYRWILRGMIFVGGSLVLRLISKLAWRARFRRRPPPHRP